MTGATGRGRGARVDGVGEVGEEEMNISDELRERASNCIDKTGPYAKFLQAIADRIDRETVELPKDVDGVPINVGDTVWGCNSGMKMTVKELRTTGTDSWIITTSRGYIQQGSGVTHTRPDSLERIADELEDWSEDNRVNGDREVFDRAADFADRIRKLAEREGE